MNRQEFLHALDTALQELGTTRRTSIKLRYDLLIRQAVALGQDEAQFIDNLGPLDRLVKKLTAEAPPKTTREPSKKMTQPQVISYVLMGLLIFVVIIVASGLFSFGASYFWWGLRRLLLVTTTTTSAQYALYIGQMVTASGLYIVLIGGLTIFIKNIPLLTKKIQQQLVEKSMKGANHE